MSRGKQEIPYAIDSTCPVILLFKQKEKVKGFSENGCNSECILPRCWEDLPDNALKLKTAISDCQDRMLELNRLIGLLANFKWR